MKNVLLSLLKYKNSLILALMTPIGFISLTIYEQLVRIKA
jgi:hypothetical protein